jgi:hypothetical protein
MPTATALAKILEANDTWILTGGTAGEWTLLCEADLSGMNLQGAQLSGAILWRAALLGTQLQGARLWGASLVGADLRFAKLSGAILWGANLTSVVFEPEPGSLPYIPSLASAKGLSQLTYYHTPLALVELREALKKAGMRQQEREVTYAIKRAERRRAGWMEKTLNLLLFEFPCNYGLSPSRPLWLLMGLIPIFAVPYWIALKQANARHGIWVIVPADRIARGRGKEKVVQLRPPTGKAGRKRLRGELLSLQTSLYFSLLSAFHLGWRELNVGTWITRLQAKEYSLRARGWVRTVSGAQSLLSVYLLALAVLSYFGRPFE